MNSLSLGIGFLAALLSVAILVVTLVTFRRPRRVTLLGPLFTMLLALVVLPLFVLLSGVQLNPLVAVPMLILGLLAGFLGALRTRLYASRDGKVTARYSLLLLGAWLGSWTLGLFLPLFESALLASLGLLPLFFCTWAQVGANGTIFIRRLKVKPAQPLPFVNRARLALSPSPPTPSPPAVAATDLCPNCGAEKRPGVQFCWRCGTLLAGMRQQAVGPAIGERGAAAGHPAGATVVCWACGARVRVTRFCTQCGVPLAGPAAGEGERGGPRHS